MSEFEFSTLGMLVLLLVLIGGYSYWQVYRAQRVLRQTVADEVETLIPVLDDEIVTEPMTDEVVASQPLSEARVFNQQDEKKYAALSVFEPMNRFLTWLELKQLQPIDSINGVVDVVLSQPKNNTDIERALEGLPLDFALPLRLYGRRAGQEAMVWETLETGVLYIGLRLTLQLANATHVADVTLIDNWFGVTQKLAKRLAASIPVWPDSAELSRCAADLHGLAQHLNTPLVVQLHKPTGLWPAYEVHQNMTQRGITLNDDGQYIARAQDGALLYTMLNDISNLRAQDFHKDVLPTMHINTLSFCLDLARIDVAYQPSSRLWRDLEYMAHGLQGEWTNIHNEPLNVAVLMQQTSVQVAAYYQQLQDLNIPAGSMMLRRLLRG